jgi:hypothetical protein
LRRLGLVTWKALSQRRGLSADLKKANAENEDPELVLVMEYQLADVLAFARRLRNGRR